MGWYKRRALEVVTLGDTGRIAQGIALATDDRQLQPADGVHALIARRQMRGIAHEACPVRTG